MYQEADRQLDTIKRFLAKETLHLDNTGFDEIRSISTKTVTTRLMKKLKAKNKKSFWICALLAYRDAIKVANEKGWKGKGDGLQEAWIV